MTNHFQYLENSVFRFSYALVIYVFIKKSQEQYREKNKQYFSDVHYNCFLSKPVTGVKLWI